ncbi:unnamed protein product [Lepidochelys kempii]
MGRGVTESHPGVILWGNSPTEGSDLSRLKGGGSSPHQAPSPPCGACNCLWMFHSPGLLRPPEVSEISQPESVTAGEEITLSCRMVGHFPGVLCVTWLRRNRGAGAAVRILNSTEYRIEPGAPHTQDGKSFQQETRLRFTPSVQRDQGAEYVCRVGHVILRTPVERRSRELQVTGLIFRLEKPATRTGC